jgi:hypothetical protein
MFSIRVGIKVLSFLLVVKPISASCQTTFNHAYEFGFHTLLTNIIETDAGFIGGGYTYDTSGTSYKGYLTLFDNYGNLDYLNTLEDSSQYFSIGQDVNSILNDSVIVMAALTFTDTIEFCKLFWLNHTGDTLFTRNYTSPYLGNDEETDWMRPTSIDVDSQHNIYVSCQLFWPSETSNDFMIMKLNAQGDSLWSYLVNEEGSEYCFDIEALDDGVIIAGGSLNNQSSQTFIKLDGDGNELSEWTFNVTENFESVGNPREIVLETDGIVVACEHSQDATQYRLPAIIKTDFDGNILWYQYLTGSEMGNAHQYCYHIVKSDDGGYLAAAWQYEENPSDPEVNGDYNWNAWLIKVSHEGVLEWERFYHFVESTEDKHRVYDLKATSDGGYIFCGDAIDEDAETNGQVTQQGWLVKVDACGCLVPGCDVECTIGVNETENDARKYFIYGPNPASQYLNVYFFEGIPDAIVSIYDLNGKRLDSFIPRQGKTTFMLNIESYTSGTYILSCEKDGLLLQSERITIQ